MTSIIKLTPYSGALDETPPCYMLQVDEFRFLLDCGWDEHFDMNYMETLKQHINQIDAVLISYPDHLHLGSLPYLVGKCGLKCPIYSTIPVYKMGQMFMYDLYQSRHNSEDFSLFTLDDVDTAFDKITQLKYSQSVSLKGKGHGLTITPLPAGHMIGGTIWKIVKDGEEEIVYAVDYNHKKERHLNGCVLEALSRPSVLITDSFNATYLQARRRARDEQLMTIILNTMRNDGNVLVSVDTAGRVVELALLLDQLWRNADSGLSTYSLAMLNNVSYNVVEFAKSQMEWMSEKVMRSFEDKRNNPFQFKHLKLCHSLKELAKVPAPKVVLASVPDLESGYSRDLFVDWAGDPKNHIVLTCRTSPGTLARNFINNPTQDKVTLKVSKRMKLEKEELDQYRQKEKERKAAEAEQKMLEAESSDESEEEMEGDEMGMSLNKSKGKAIQHDLMMRTDSGKKGTSFFKDAKKSFKMFPFLEERIRWDDYGEIIKPEDYMVADNQESEEDKAKTDEEGMDTDDQGDGEIDVPTKCVAKEVTVDIKASITFIDFEGRSDGESMKKLITQVKPRQLILVHGVLEATQHMAEYCRLHLPGGKVFTPRVNEIVDATTDSHIYQVRLLDSLVSSIEFSKTRDAELAWIDAILDIKESDKNKDVNKENTKEDMEDETSAPGLESDKKKAVEERIPTLDALTSAEITGHDQVFINAPRFQDLKQVMSRHGLQAEFSGGALVCNNSVAIKKNETGRIVLEGCLGEDYFRVRELLYDQYAIV
ncbi:cleavage and polyadenylation specificity factor subunit 2-like [Amphiura filiformis]|uniref:cleavage and polyadenylation specificity factor subunit 2-like n=1 Tax=Amphiura filiformis TaxID=82378 RepID=UPI003B21A32F